MTAPTGTDVDRGFRAPIGRSWLAIYRLQLRLLVTWGRLATMTGLGALAVIIGAALGSGGRGTGTENATELVALYGLLLLLPVASLVFASSALGDPREDGTLVYLWMRPLPRWVTALASWAAALTITLPITVVPLTLAAALAGAPSDLVVATALATGVGAVAYTAVFGALGLRTRRSLLWGLLYLFIWEGFVANASDQAAQLAILAYTQSLLSAASGQPLDLAVVVAPWSWIVPLLVAAVALVYTVHRLRVQEVP